jgi:two-component system, cell cycle sensor histidine kinase and response regulator CckA
VLTDMVMPEGVTGGDLAAALRRERPGLRIIYSSGYSAEVIAGDLVLESGVNFIQKPYDPAQLARIIRTCLDNPVPG